MIMIRKGGLMRDLSVLLLLLLLSGCATVHPPKQMPCQTAPAGTYHVVEKGQTLWRISKMYGVSVKELMSANGISDVSRLETGQRLRIPGAVSPALLPSSRAVTALSVEECVGRPSGNVAWRTITLHHSATRCGNGRMFDQYHRKRGMGGLFYHFLIGNGNGLGDGQIEVGWRWKQQSQVNRPLDIQICLVGNFEKQQVTERQYESLKTLVTVLRRRYGMYGRGSVRKHRDVGKKATECPGTYFPYGRLLKDLEGG
jgi:LysM repeat protein